MQETQANSPASASSSFVSVIASLAKGPRAGDSAQTPPKDEAVLADDLVALSYEQALRTHARYRPPATVLLNSPGGAVIHKTAKSDSAGFEDLAADESTKSRRAVVYPASSTAGRGAFEERRKTSSITIRLSQADCAQLRARAAGAGFNVSAYLRSCAFEVEDLRAQVKEALAQLREAVAVDQPATSNPDPVNVHTGWRSRIFAYWRRSRPERA